jgi:hypothetical protein
MSSVEPTLNVSRRALAPRLALLALAIVLGLAGQHWLESYLAQIQEYAKTDLLGARAWLARVFEIGGLLLFGCTGVVGVGVLQSCRRSLVLGVFPAPGLWSWGSAVRFTGARARTMARIGLVLGAMLVAASAAGAGLCWYAAAVLRACRAGVPH